jgi:rhodanese-related sulfurtransferase
MVVGGNGRSRPGEAFGDRAPKPHTCTGHQHHLALEWPFHVARYRGAPDAVQSERKGVVLHVPEIDARELAGKMTAPERLRPALLDVRMPWEHRLAALPGSILIPLQELPGRAAELEALRGREVVVYCHHGQRSLSGAAFLRQRGIDARSLSGGIDGYSASVDPRIPRY